MNTWPVKCILPLEGMEKQHIARALMPTKNMGIACNILNMPWTTLWRRMQKYNLGHKGVGPLE